MYEDSFTLLWQCKRILKVRFDDLLGHQSSNKMTLKKLMKKSIHSVFTYTFYLPLSSLIQLFSFSSELFKFYIFSVTEKVQMIRYLFQVQKK